MNITIKINLLAAFLILSSTHTQEQYCSVPAEYTIILKIGNAERTRYELKSFLDAYIEKHKNSSLLNEKEIINNGINEFINDTYFLADAYDKEIDNITSLNERIVRTSRFLMVQKYGPLYQEIIEKKVIITTEELQEAIMKRKRIVKAKYIIMPKIFLENLLKIDSVNYCLDLITFQKIMSDSCVLRNIKIVDQDIIYPFLLFSKTVNDEIYNLKIGEITKPILLGDKVCYVLKKADSLNFEAEDQENRQKILSSLKIQKRKEIEKTHEEKISSDVITIKNEKNISKFAGFIVTINLMKEDIDNALHCCIVDTLMKINIAGLDTFITVGNFINYYKYLPVKRLIKTKEDINDYLDIIKNEEYEYRLAQKLSLYKTDSFINEIKNYKHKCMINEVKRYYSSKDIPANLLRLKNKFTIITNHIFE